MPGTSAFARRSLPLRSTALASALALTLAASGDAYGLHDCAHHDTLPTQTGHANGAHGRHSAHGAIDGTAVDAAAHTSHDSSEHEGGCPCVGDCAGATAAALPTSPAAAGADTPATAASAAAIPSDAPRAARTQHFHPFAQAPPLDR
ncbi:MAG TPA: hypothetical protein VMN78_11440 [Longimicrobiales bacterium]|nr:hypothetical protein [Longimicrobiales bacterium]